MNKKGPRVDRATAKGGTKNELYVPSSMNPPELKIEIRGESGKLVENFHDLSADSGKNRAVITLSFDGNTGQHQSDDPNKVIYRVVNPNPQSIEEWKKMKKEALADFLINKSNKSFLDVSKHDNSNSDFEYTLKKDKGKINLLVEKRDKSEKKIIESKNLELDSKFYFKEIIRDEDFVSISPPPPPWWKTTKGKIIILAGFGIILILIFLFRKKIWGWVKRDKKKKEQIVF